MKKFNKKSGIKKKSKGRQALERLADDSLITARSTTIRFASDIKARPTSWALTQNPPPNIINRIFWTQQTYSMAVNIGASTTFAENNFNFALSNCPQAAALVGLFDQYCIHSAVFSFAPRLSQVGFAELGRFVTAIDYDNTNNLGSAALIQEYASAETTELVTGQSIQRTLQPCVAPALYNVSTTTPIGYGTGRFWVDSANSSTPHYGVRTGFYYSNLGNTAFGIEINVALVLGFRSLR